jgi:predicted alpha/beta superfamily hydrolase
MERYLLVLLMSMLVPISHGKIVFEGPMPSRFSGTNRFVRIYLPPTYEAEAARRYPVLYVHDGQNAFASVGDHVAFGWGNWQLDKTVDELIAARKMREIILVAIDCSRERYLDYRGPAYPYSPDELAELKRPTSAPGDNRRFENYTHFLVHELKPRIDREYRTLSGPEHTGVLGSSMGGICSVVQAWEHPEIFGLAASLSGAFQVERRYFLLNVLQQHLGPPKAFRVYLDSGVVDFSGGDDGRKHTAAVARELRRIGWKDGVNLVHYLDEKPLSEPELEKAGLRPDKWKEAQTSQHNEFYWRLRVWRALVFLFPPLDAD